MKLIASDTGQVFQRFEPDEVRPEREIFIPQLFALARERYGFLGASDPAAAKDAGAKFRDGCLAIAGRQIAVAALEIYTDGVIVRCRDTNDADVVLDDAIEWLIKTFGVRRPQTTFQRNYQSHLVVEFDGRSAIHRFEMVAKIMGAAFNAAHPLLKGEFDVQRLAFAIDPALVPPHTTTGFIFERRGQALYSLNRYFCMAPLRTEDHVRLLEEIEKVWAT